MTTAEKVWVAFGFVAQGMFFARFLVQWIASERRGESYIPVQFWYFSIAGSLMLLACAIHRQDPVFILGQSTGLIIYVRNLMLIGRKKRAGSGVSPEGETGFDGDRPEPSSETVDAGSAR